MGARLLGLAHEDVRGRRYVLGRTVEVYALWDGAVGGVPLEVFPLSTEGWTRAWLRHRELEAVVGTEAEPPAAPYPLTVGQIVGAALRLWVRHFWKLAALSALLVVPAWAISMAVVLPTMRAVDTVAGLQVVNPLWATVVNNAVSAAAVGVVGALVVRAGVLAIQGRAPSMGDSFRAAAGRLGTVLLVTLVGSLAVALPLLPGWLLIGVGDVEGSEAIVAAGVVLVFVGLIPAAFLAMRFLLATAVAVVERRRGLAPLGRSWRLVQGLTWRTLGTILLVALLLVGVSLVIVTVVLAAVVQSSDGVVTEPLLRSVVLWSGIASAVLFSVGLPFAHLAVTLLYVDSRVRKERLDLDALGRETGA
jgi:hypothetical protein